MIRFLLLLGAFALAACAQHEESMEEPMIMEEPIMEESLPSNRLDDTSCKPEGDGIGGTGCPAETM